MTALTHDTVRVNRGAGFAFALLSACAFGLSGSLAKGLMDSGWTAGSATIIRVAIAAAVLTIPALIALGGRRHLLAKAAGTVIAYGVFAVAGAQLFYFMAVQHLDVGVALLVEYMAPVLVVGWLWMTRGHRPGRLTLLGGTVALAGLVLLLDLFSANGPVSLQGIGWALGAMVGCAVYFVISGSTSTGLPPVTLAWGGLVVAAVLLVGAGLVGILPLGMSTAAVAYASFTAPWWAVALTLGTVTAAVAYVAGIAATRRLGARLASFVALFEVLMASTFAWLFLAQAPVPVQIGGAALVLVGVILVKMGEPSEPGAADPVVEALPIESGMPAASRATNLNATAPDPTNPHGEPTHEREPAMASAAGA